MATNNRLYAAMIAKALQRLIGAELGELIGMDMTLTAIMPYKDYYTSDDEGIYMEVANEGGQAEIAIKITTRTNSGFDDALEDNGPDDEYRHGIDSEEPGDRYVPGI